MQTDGNAVQTGLRPFILKNANLVEVHIIQVGASIQRIIVPDKNGFAADVVLGFDSAEQYLVRVCVQAEQSCSESDTAC